MSEKKSITRREFVKKAGQAGLTVALGGAAPSLARTARAAAKRDYILVGHPNPSTGPIASFGEASPWADNLAIGEINKAGGIMIKEAGKKLPIKLKMVDTASDPTKAADVASKLILNDKVDIMIALHTPDTVNPVTSICERYEVPCVSLDAPIEAWLTGGPYKWSFHSFWSVNDVIDVFTGLWDQIHDEQSRGRPVAQRPRRYGLGPDVYPQAEGKRIQGCGRRKIPLRHAGL